jgi:GT2 family glycosyltransferase
MQVSFIIPLFNCLPLSQAMLASLRATLPAGLAHEIILVDDGSTDGTRTWLAGLPSPCRVLLNEANLGFAAACNRGAAAATGEQLFFLNNDLVLLPRWLEPMRALLAQSPDAGLIGNVQLNAADGAIDHTGIFFNHKGKPEHSTARPWLPRLLGRRPMPALTGACCAIRRSLWRELGGFDEGFVNGAEDIDLCLRAAASGRRNYVALRSVVRHHISSSPGRKLRDEFNSYRLVQRWRETIAGLAVRDWSRQFIETHWDRSFVFDDALGRAALFCRLGLLPGPAPAVEAAVRAAIEVELARWKELSPVPAPAAKA